MRRDWSQAEVEATVADYFHMLTQELAGQSYNKTEHRSALKKKLSNRSDGSIELKHQNISAVLFELGCPWISGYKPRGNYQGLLFDVVAEQVSRNSLFDRTATSAAEQTAIVPLLSSIGEIVVPPPVLKLSAKEPVKEYKRRTVGFRRDYIEREARNSSLGLSGERFVLSYEQKRLHQMGKKKLSERVEHVSSTKGDGLGFDILSFEKDGKERYIEVKTTSFPKETPFFISKSEIEFSKAFSPQFRLYRLFEFRRNPRIFILPGEVSRNCILDPVSFLATFG
jgi:hypothetical protein